MVPTAEVDPPPHVVVKKSLFQRVFLVPACRNRNWHSKHLFTSAGLSQLPFFGVGCAGALSRQPSHPHSYQQGEGGRVREQEWRGVPFRPLGRRLMRILGQRVQVSWQRLQQAFYS